MNIHAAWMALWSGPQIVNVEVYLPLTLTTAYRKAYSNGPFFLSPITAFASPGTGPVHRYSVFEAAGKWYGFAGKFEILTEGVLP